MRKLIFLLILTVRFGTCYAQFDTLEIPLDPAFATGKEFSGLAMHDDLLFLLPQCKSAATDNFIYGFNTAEVYLSAHTESKTIIKPQRKFQLRGLKEFIESEKLQKSYDGLEAITFTGDTCYLLVETSSETSDEKITSDRCYLLMGILGNENGRDIIYIQDQHLPLLKPKKLPNVGFEAMYYDLSSRHLKIFFEYNAGDVYGYEVPADLSPAKKMKVPELPLRLTDITRDIDGDVFGVNYYWGGEFNTYLGAAKEQSFLKSIKGATVPLKEDKAYTFCRILQLKGGEWIDKGQVSSQATNWEGIVRYKNGFFLVSDDNANAELQSKLVYITPRM